MKIIFLGSCLILVIVPLAFVLHEVYQDGVFGRAGLLGIAFTAATFLLEWAFSDLVFTVPPPQVVMLTAFYAMFLVWHLFRFHRRVLHVRSAEERAPWRVCP